MLVIFQINKYCTYYMTDIQQTNNMTEILKKLEEIEIRLHSIENIVVQLRSSTNNMDRHITFVEKVYDVVKYPLFFILDRINFRQPYISSRHNQLII